MNSGTMAADSGHHGTIRGEVGDKPLAFGSC
jgi:hypothetical protein